MFPINHYNPFQYHSREQVSDGVYPYSDGAYPYIPYMPDRTFTSNRFPPPYVSNRVYQMMPYSHSEYLRTRETYLPKMQVHPMGSKFRPIKPKKLPPSTSAQSRKSATIKPVLPPITPASKNPGDLILDQIRSWKSLDFNPDLFSFPAETMTWKESEQRFPPIFHTSHSPISESISPPISLPETKSHQQTQELVESLNKELKATINAAKIAWVESEPEKAKHLLADLRNKIVSEARFWNPYELLMQQVLLCELEGEFENGLKIFDESLNMGLGKNPLVEKTPQYLHRLHIQFQLVINNPFKYHHLNFFNDFPFTTDIKHFFEKNTIYKKTSSVEQIKLIVNLAKFAHFSSQFDKKNEYLNLLEQFIGLEERNGSYLLGELEDLSIEIGDISPLNRFDDLLRERGKVINRKTLMKRTIRSKLSQDFISLLYLEAAGQTRYEDLKISYQSLLGKDGNRNTATHLHYLHFLIRAGELTEATAKAKRLVDGSRCSHVKEYRELMLTCIQLLINSGNEAEAMEKLQEFTQDDSKLSLFFFEKAFLHLNPLSQFYDVSEAEKIVAYMQATQIAKQYPQLPLLGYRIAALNRKERTSSERALQVLSKELFGSTKILMCAYPAQLPLHQKNKMFEDTISKNHGDALLEIGDMRKSGSLDDAFAVAERLYDETDRLALYQKFICPTGLCLGNLHEKIQTFTPSQKICALFER